MARLVGGKPYQRRRRLADHLQEGHGRLRAGTRSSWPRASPTVTGARASTSPNGISTHYTLLDLKHLSIAPGHPQLHASIGQILTQHKSADGGVNVFRRAVARSLQRQNSLLTTLSMRSIMLTTLSFVV